MRIIIIKVMITIKIKMITTTTMMKISIIKMITDISKGKMNWKI